MHNITVHVTTPSRVGCDSTKSSPQLTLTLFWFGTGWSWPWLLGGLDLESGTRRCGGWLWTWLRCFLFGRDSCCLFYNTRDIGCITIRYKYSTLHNNTNKLLINHLLASVTLRVYLLHLCEWLNKDHRQCRSAFMCQLPCYILILNRLSIINIPKPTKYFTLIFIPSSIFKCFQDPAWHIIERWSISPM